MGYGKNASHWSNSYDGQFVYQEESLIMKLVKKSNADVYYARCTSKTSFDSNEKLLAGIHNIMNQEEIKSIAFFYIV